MGRETELFRPQLERIIAAFPAQEMIPVKDAATWLGIDTRRLYSAKDSPAKKIDGRYYVTVLKLAQWMAR